MFNPPINQVFYKGFPQGFRIPLSSSLLCLGISILKLSRGINFCLNVNVIFGFTARAFPYKGFFPFKKMAARIGPICTIPYALKFYFWLTLSTEFCTWKWAPIILNYFHNICFYNYNANIQIKNENPKFKWSSQKSGFLTQNNFSKIFSNTI